MKKLLVWDGDETLWQGTILEGDEPVVPLSHQALCQELASRGVLQSLASRNHLESVLEVLHRYELDNYFLAPQADLARPKSSMIRSIMSDLGLSKDSDVVFVDDTPYNLAEVSDALPGVLAVSPPQLEEAVKDHFSKPSYTAEDRYRVRRYRDEEVRKQASRAYDGDRTAFLRNCGLCLTISPCQDGHLERAVDLVKRANRMSALARSFSEEDVRGLKDSLYVGMVEDKYGDYGLSVLLGVENAHVIMLVVSCRLQGKGIGSAMLGWCINRHFGKTLTARWAETEHNQSVRELYRWYGFVEFVTPGSVLYNKEVKEPVQLPDWVRVKERL